MKSLHSIQIEIQKKWGKWQKVQRSENEWDMEKENENEKKVIFDYFLYS